MRLVNVNDVRLQFDIPDDMDVTEDGIRKYIRELNIVLRKHFKGTEPRILLNKNHIINVVKLEDK